VETYRNQHAPKFSKECASTIKILQSLCVSYKIVETYRKTEHAPKFSKGKIKRFGNGSTDF
jgi:hypothetical protein